MSTKIKLILGGSGVWLGFILLTYAFFYVFQKPIFLQSQSALSLWSVIEWSAILSACLIGQIYFMFVRRLETLSQQIAVLIEKNEYEKPFAVNGEDTISVLTNQINTLFGNIINSDEKLEHRIRTRTKKLQDRIDELDARLINREKEKNELISHNESLIKMAHYDSLTGLPSRILFNEKLNQIINGSKENKKVFSLLMISLDNFKSINDSLGCATGDAILIEMGNRLQTLLRSDDVLARSGGAEFSILLTDIVHPEVASLIAEKILKIAGAPMEINHRLINLQLNIGIVIAPEDGDSLERLLENADRALFKTKKNKECRYLRYQKDMEINPDEVAKLKTLLNKAIENREFVLYYQPKLNLKDNSMIGIEALVRWENAMLGLITPARFISIAEETGIILQLGEWVLREACRANKSWQNAGLAHVPIAVNISPQQFFYQNLPETIKSVLSEIGLEPHYLEVEINSSVLRENYTSAINILKSIRDIGVRITIDDFGNEALSISDLKELPISTLKIDQQFIKDIPENQKNIDITNAVIDLAHNLNVEVAAAGIETINQLEHLIGRNCTVGQGYFFSKPLSESSFVESDFFKEPAATT